MKELDLMMMTRLDLKRQFFAAGVILAATASNAAVAASPDLFRGVPKDAVATYFVAGAGDPSKDGNNGINGSIGATTGSAQNPLAMADFWISHAQDLGLFSSLDETCRAWLDGLGMAMLILRYPHAVTLIDIDAISLETGHHAVRQLRAAVIVHTKGRNEEIERRIQHLLNAYTNKDESTLGTDTIAERRVTTLRDRRLLEWAIFRWGAIGDDYVLALGDGAYERIETTLKDETKSIAGEAWFKSAAAKLNAGGADFFGVANLESLRRGSDGPLWKRIHRASRELHLDGVDQAAIAVTMKSRDIDVTALLRRGDENSIVPLTMRDSDEAGILKSISASPDEPNPKPISPSGGEGSVRGSGPDSAQSFAARTIPPDAQAPLSPPGGEGRVRGAGEDSLKGLESKAVPPDATWSLMLDIAPHEWMKCIVNAYLVGRRADARREMQRDWELLESEAGISIEKDIFGPMGRGIVVHDYPKHAFHLPLAWTRLIRISGDPVKLRQSVDKLFGVWRQRLGESNPLQLRRADDGVWFLYFGLEGPALKVEDQWIVVSFSPEAVRENAKCVRAKAENSSAIRGGP